MLLKHQHTHTRWVIALTILAMAGCQSAEDQSSSAEVETGMAVHPHIELTEVWTLAMGLDHPESAIYDPDRGVIYLSNLAGGGDEMDSVGYIATVSPDDGALIDAGWVTGLHAPKGLALGEDRLYAADINTLLEIDLDSGEILMRHTVEGEAYLNDVTVGDDGVVYVSDSRYSKVYVLQDGSLDVWLEHGNVLNPNGVHVMGDDLYIAAGDSLAERPGRARYLQAVSLQDRVAQPLHDRTPVGALDAVEPDGAGGLFVTDWGSGQLMHFQSGRGLTLLKALGQGAADVEFVQSAGMLYVPVMMEGQLIAYKVNRRYES